ncbi:unnamed protein product, partial [Rotaria sordida]
VVGFVVNRLQCGILSSSLQLVQDGIVEPDDINRAIIHELACRWSFMEPFQAIDLNALKEVIDCKVFIFFNRYGSSIQHVLIDMNFPTDWTQENVEKSNNYFHSKYPIDLAKHKQTYADRDYRIVHYPLSMPTNKGQARIQAIENELKQINKQIKIRLVPHNEANIIDFFAEPGNLAATNLGTNEIFCQLGKFSIVTKEDEPYQNFYQPKTCGQFQHILISSTNCAKSTILFEIDVKKRLTDECKEENNFISVIRYSLKQYSKEPMVLEGIFRIEKGIIKVHVMPDFLNEDLITGCLQSSLEKTYPLEKCNS